MLAHAYVLIQHMPTIVDDDMFSRLLIVSLLLFVYTQVGPMVPGCAHKYIYIYCILYILYIYTVYTLYIYVYCVYIYCIIYIYIYCIQATVDDTKVTVSDTTRSARSILLLGDPPQILPRCCPGLLAGKQTWQAKMSPVFKEK